MNTKKAKSIAAKSIASLVIISVILLVVFLIGRYGWKLCGFRACQSAGIESVEVSNKQVKITGFYPGLFPQGFLGYHAEEENGKLYVGFKFSALFGIFETGNFDIIIPVKGEIDEVVIKASMNEYTVWTSEDGFLRQGNRYGVYVKLEPNDIYSVAISYDGYSGGLSDAGSGALESGEYLYMDSDIIYAAKESEKSIPFTLTVKKADGSVFASGSFTFNANMEKMYLTVTSDGQICQFYLRQEW